MSTRSALLSIGGLFWLAAVGCWLRGRGSWRLPREGMLFFLAGLPFLAAGAFYAASSYPQDVGKFVNGPAGAPLATPAQSVKSHGPWQLAATPAAPAPRGRTFADAVRINQLVAVARHPDLGVEGSPFNRRFLAEYRRLQFEDPAYLANPAWPLRLANSVARSLAGFNEPSPAPESASQRPLASGTRPPAGQ